MKTSNKYSLRAASALIAMAGLAFSNQAYCNDAPVKFNMQISAQKLDPQVNMFSLTCNVFDANDNFIAKGTATPIFAQSQPVNMSATVNVPSARVKDAKKWWCQLGFIGPGGAIGNGTQDWSKLSSPNESTYMRGVF